MPSPHTKQDLCKAVIAEIYDLRLHWAEAVTRVFDNQVFRCFCVMHTRFRTGIVDYVQHNRDTLETVVAKAMMPRPGDMDLCFPEPEPSTVSRLKKMGFEAIDIVPRCILIPGALIRFDGQNQNEWGGLGDVAIAEGLLPDWDQDPGVDYGQVRAYLSRQITVEV